MKNKLMLSLAVILLWLSSACKKDLGRMPNETDKVDKQVKGKTYNPYSVENMRKAMASLMMKDVQLLANNKQKYAHGKMVSTNSSAPLAINTSLTAKESVTLVEKGILPTHYYIKFMPANDGDYAKLKVDSNLIIYPFPLDAAVSTYSGNYRDPSLPVGVPTYQYASVPVNYILPNVSYVKLADLYLPNESSASNMVTIKGEDNSSYSVSAQMLAEESICGGNDDPPPAAMAMQAPPPEDCDETYGGGGPSTGTDAPAGEWRPSGRITMNDDSLGTIGVEGIKVRARRWFTTYTGITDADGYYHVDGTYTRPANYWLDFERYDFSVNDHYGGPREISGPKVEEPWNVDFTGYDKFCATIFRAAFHYYYGNIQGLRRPPQNSFWATQVKIAAFDWQQTSDNGDMWAMRNTLLGSLIHIYKPQKPSDQIYATTIHELAHAVHWDMWPYAFSITENIVSESWATGVQYALTGMVYTNYVGRWCAPGDLKYKNVIMDMIDGAVPIPYPMTNFTNYGLSGNEDLVEGYSITEIELALIGQTTWNDWKNSIKSKLNNGTEQHIDALFTTWYNH